MKKHYDTIIIGSDLSGYLTATALTLQGQEVLLIPQDTFYHGYQIQNYKFEHTPYALTGFNSEWFKKLTAQVGFDVTDLSLIKRFVPPYQIVFPEHRIDMYQEPHLRLLEFKREFGAKAEELFHLFTRIETQETSPLEDAKKMNEYTRNMGTPDMFKQMLLGQALYFSNSYLDNPSINVIGTLLAGAHQGLFYIKGGLSKLYSILAEKINAAGSLVREDILTQAIVSEKDTITGVQVSSHEGFIRCGRLILNGYLHSSGGILESLEEGSSKKRLLSLFDTMEYPVFKWSIHMGIDQKAIPVGMGDNIIMWNNNDLDPLNGNLLFLHVSGRHEVSRAPVGQRILSITAMVPYEDSFMQRNSLRKLTIQMLEQTSKLIPFLDQHIFMIFSPPLIQHRTSRRWFHQNHLVMFQGKTSQPHPHPFMTSYRNMYMIGRNVRPELGCPGELEIAQALIQYMQKS